MLGRIYGTTYSGELLVRVEKLPSLNQMVHDRRKGEIGRVVHIFGNVTSPHAIIRPHKKINLLQMVGREVYIR